VLADATAVPSPSSVLLGLEGFVVLAVADAGGEIEMLIETDADLVGCPDAARWPLPTAAAGTAWVTCRWVGARWC
jgi:hypothetical protein